MSRTMTTIVPARRPQRASSNFTGDGFEGMIGRSGTMREVYQLIERVAPTDANVLVTGESGTGKELVAEAIHRLSERADAPFVAFNCGAVPPDLIDSELFGHEKGAFTGATAAHRGVFERARGGTLFLDEVTEMPLERQARLLRVLETRQVNRVGGEALVPVNCRIVAATNRPPEPDGRYPALREDLQYRLAVFPIHLPPLRKRGSDVVLLAERFIEEFNQKHGAHKPMSPNLASVLVGYPWPGNVRQLRHALLRAYILAEDEVGPEHLPEIVMDALAAAEARVSHKASATGPTEREASDAAVATAVAVNSPASTQTAPRASQASCEEEDTPAVPHVDLRVGQTVAEAERRLIEVTLEVCGDDKPKAAAVLGISLKTLYNRLNRYRAEDGDDEQGAA